MQTLAALFVVLAGALLSLLGFRRNRAEVALRKLFEPGTEFIGKDIHYITRRAGPSAFFGSMDHGLDVAQWEAGDLLAEVWFQTGACIEIEVRPIRK